MNVREISMFEVLITCLYLALSLQVSSVLVGNPNVLDVEPDDVFLSVAMLYRENRILFDSTQKITTQVQEWLR